MADASIIDIGGVQWNVKDKEARDKIAVIEDFITTKELPNPTVTKTPGTNWTSLNIQNHYSFGKIHFIYLRLQNVSNGNIGTTTSANICKFDIFPVRVTSFMMFDYINGKIMRCYFETNGQVVVGESNGVSSGNNVCFGELIFAEA